MPKIVVADDHEMVRSGIKSLLDGHPSLKVCGVAANGKEAIDKVLELEPDLVIMDLSMPLLSGFLAALKIRQQAPHVKILVLSIHDDVVAEQVAHLMGADAFLRKTATGQELISTISSVLGMLSMQPARGRSTSPVPENSE